MCSLGFEWGFPSLGVYATHITGRSSQNLDSISQWPLYSVIISSEQVPRSSKDHPSTELHTSPSYLKDNLCIGSFLPTCLLLLFLKKMEMTWLQEACLGLCEARQAGLWGQGWQVFWLTNCCCCWTLLVNQFVLCKRQIILCDLPYLLHLRSNLIMWS